MRAVGSIAEKRMWTAGAPNRANRHNRERVVNLNENVYMMLRQRVSRRRSLFKMLYDHL